MKIKNKMLLSITGIITVLLITIGVSFAYFTANISGGEESTTVTIGGGTMNITYSGGAIINVDDITPGNNPVTTKTFTVTGNSTLDISMGYKISLVVNANKFSKDALKYKLISINTNNNGTVVKNINTLTNIGTGSKTIELGIGEFISPTEGNKVHTYNLELYFPETGLNQNADQDKSFTAHVKIENSQIDYLGFEENKGVNRPVLFTGMTPIKWVGITETSTTADDPEWYDYNTKKWANAKTTDGSYWVWIPRYAYKITSGYHSSETGKKDVRSFDLNKSIF